jgi:hypothetical protein
MYRARSMKTGYGKKRRSMRGRGLGDWLRKAGSFIKNNKLVSRGLGALAGVVPAQYKPLASGAAGIASQLGLGRRRRVVRRGGSLGGALSLAGGSLGGAMRRLRLR